MWRKLFSLTKLFIFWMLCCCSDGRMDKIEEKLTRNIFNTTPQPTSTTNKTKPEATTTIDPQTLRQMRNRERKKEERLIMIQAEILKRLGFERQPNITSIPFNPEKRRKINRFQLSIARQRPTGKYHDYDDDYAKQFQSFYASCSVPRNSIKDEWENTSYFRVYFDLTSHISRSSLATAKLHLYKYKNSEITTTSLPTSASTRIPGKGKYIVHKKDYLDPQEYEEDKLQVNLYQYGKAIKSNKKLKKKLVESHMINANFEGWIEFDVKSSVKEWLQYSNRNFGLEINVENSDRQAIPPLFKRMNCSDHEMPFPTFAIEEASGTNDNTTALDNETYPRLDIMTLESSYGHLHRRQTREAQCSSKKETKGNCCTESMYISFEELGWDKWIIAPTGFYTSYCMGSCRLRKHSILNSVLPKIPPPFSQNSNGGCVPRVVRPLQITYINEHHQRKRLRLEDVVVSQCGCVE